MVTQAPFLFLLVEVDRNSATFAVLTKWTRADGSLGVRVPSPNSDENIKKVVDEKFDKSAPYIRGWREFYSWLGRGGWARFSPEDGAKLIPGWLAPATEYVCT